MLTHAGHGLVVVVNARSLAGICGGNLSQVPQSRFNNWQGLGFGAILLEKIWQEPGDGKSGCVDAFAPDHGLGGTRGLDIFRQKAAQAGLSLLLDFPPFQVAQTNPILTVQPNWMIHQPVTPEVDMAQGAWFAREVEPGQFLAIARGKDPYFPPVPGSAQLNPCHPGLREHMQSVLARIATLCDGAWFSSAMLALPVGIEKTWGELKMPSMGGAIVEDSLWPDLMDSARDVSPDFLGLAEAYWGVEWDLMGQGFDFCLDQRMVGRLGQQDWTGVTAHLAAPWDYLRRTLHRWNEIQDSLNGLGGQEAFLIWSLFLATPGLKLVESEFLDGFTEGVKAGELARYPAPFSAVLKAVSVLDAEWVFRPLEFPGKQLGFDGAHWGLVWTRISDGETRHLLFLARLQDGEGTELVVDLGAGVCRSIRQVPIEMGVGQNQGAWKENSYHVVLKDQATVFFEIRPTME